MDLRHKVGRGWRRTFRELPEKEVDANRTGVAYVAVLFSIVVGKLAEGSVEPVKALLDSHGTFAQPGAATAHYVLGLVLTITSFVGYFASKNSPQLQIKFFNFPLLQIILDSSMVIVYFFVAVYAERARDPANARPEAVLISMAFALYTVWDFLGWRLRRDPLAQLALGRAPDSHYGFRRMVTVCFLAVSLVMTAWLFFAAPTNLSAISVIEWDVALIAVLLAYRVVKAMGDVDIHWSGGDDRSDQGPARRGQARGYEDTVKVVDWDRLVPDVVKNDLGLLTEALTVFPNGIKVEPEARPVAERLRAVGAVTLQWDGVRDTATLTEAGHVYVALRAADPPPPPPSRPPTEPRAS